LVLVGDECSAPQFGRFIRA